MNIPNHPSYGQIRRRLSSRLDIDSNGRVEDDDDGDIDIAIDSTGIKVTNRGQWLEICGISERKGTYLKIHVAVKVKTKQILSL